MFGGGNGYRETNSCKKKAKASCNKFVEEKPITKHQA